MYNGLSFDIAPGSSVGVVGRTGSGGGWGGAIIQDCFLIRQYIAF